ncbi:hypothetical protein PoB_000208800 [Plakobranchus ocellatus]|uniref:Uncharacterized protein n=1 Tax=Plakobranchus ocellatus TaxID=259542 RepID=A0AAV3XZD4_9GAST|nr:hypothetical protein PoB_000208800 [Plakobranchus ocellatus]
MTQWITTSLSDLQRPLCRVFKPRHHYPGLTEALKVYHLSLDWPCSKPTQTQCIAFPRAGKQVFPGGTSNHGELWLIWLPTKRSEVRFRVRAKSDYHCSSVSTQH